MHKKFYVSGFIYHSSSQQILLQQNSSISPLSPSWVLFEGSYKESENPESLFQSMIMELLGVKTGPVHEIYSYMNKNGEESHSLVYSTVRKLQDFPSKMDLHLHGFLSKM